MTNQDSLGPQKQSIESKKAACKKIDSMLNMLQHTSVQIHFFMEVTAEHSNLEISDFEFLVSKVADIKLLITEFGFMDSTDASLSDDKEKLKKSLLLSFTVLEKNAQWLLENYKTDEDLPKSLATFMEMIDQCKGFFELPL